MGKMPCLFDMIANGSGIGHGNRIFGDSAYHGNNVHFLIAKLAKALDADEDELLLLAEKVPEQIRRRVMERPDAFRKFATLDDDTLDGLLAQLGETPAPRRRTKLKAR